MKLKPDETVRAMYFCRPISMRQRKKYFNDMVQIFGVDAMSALFYSMLSVRAFNGLIALRSDYQVTIYVGKIKKFIPLNKLVTLSPEHLNRARNFGRKSLEEVQKLLEQFGLSMNMSQEEIKVCFNPPKHSRK